jgi:hypothetical protein
MNIEQLKKAESDAYSAWHKENEKLNEAIRTEEAEARERIRRAHAEEQKEVERLATVKWEATRARQLGEVEAAKTAVFKMNDGTEIRAGDVVQRYGSRGWRGSKQEWRGLVEIATPATRWPDNIRHSLPRPGELFVRLYKKDGTLGQAFDQLRSYAAWNVIGHQD